MKSNKDFSREEKKKTRIIIDAGFCLYARHEHYLSRVEVRVSPNSGNYIAKSKGVHCEVKSKGSWRQTSDLTNRNFIQGI